MGSQGFYPRRMIQLTDFYTKKNKATTATHFVSFSVNKKPTSKKTIKAHNESPTYNCTHCGKRLGKRRVASPEKTVMIKNRE
jgi:transcription elongation factor Elf1